MGYKGFLKAYTNSPWRNCRKFVGDDLSLGKTELTVLPCDMFLFTALDKSLDECAYYAAF